MVARKRINQLDLFYQDDDFSDPWRRRETILMLHGFGRNGNCWRAWVPTLARHYRVIRPDVRGCGQSEDPGPEFIFDIEDVVSDYIGLLDALEIEAVHHVGEATGGIVGVMVATRHPNRILSLTLISTPTSPGTGNPTAHSAGFTTPQVAMETLGMKEWWLRTHTLDDRAKAEYLADEVARTPVHWAVSMYGYMHGPKVDTIGLLSRIKVPTLVLSPASVFSGSTTPEQQRTMFRLVPNARQKIYEGLPSELVYTRPDELARDTLNFINSVR